MSEITSSGKQNKNSPNGTGVQKIRTMIEGFDDISHGGLPLGRTTLFSGTSGTGKTLFSVQFLYNGILFFDEPGVFVTFEESPSDIIKNAYSFGWNLPKLIEEGKLFILDASPDPEGQEVIGNFDLSALIERLQYAIHKYKARRVAIDSITAVFQQYEAASVVRREIFRLVARLKQIGVTTIITTERTEEYGAIASFGVEEFVADNVAIVRNVLEGERRRRTMEILKLRGTTHMKGEYPFTITNDGVNIFPLGAMRLTQRSSNVRVSSGVKTLDEMCGGGFFKDSIILATGATGTGKTLLVSKFLENGCRGGERAILFAYEESRAQLSRNAYSWGIDFEDLEKKGLLKIICAYPESAGLEDHLQIIKSEIAEFKPARVAIDSLSALARGVSNNAFRQFVIGVTGFAKQEEITGFFTNTTDQFMGAHSITESHISTITDTILLLQYVEIRGQMSRAINVFKMRGSWHDNGIREYTISADGPEITDSFSNYEGIISGSPSRVSTDEKAELSRIVKGFQGGE
ncbi:MAG: Circadian clock protein kinase KaiC [Chroococcidiopsis cubana SAG 39.79]|jgi:circadian clock protein KaiC|uniref:Circadian clock oscillator protein KaiC n=1 Tax=Chroococcidiopsis cubana SAG 39.79 TaxID=388085 RepID=A0AB37UNQ0_9CYAN|nr:MULTISPECIES: circadian clock protein KaiC [Chroococcidiopsis]PSB45979.1 circadian clock protein KaiC [Cyanosarcina cf. burmensis CCALA 770]MDZ4871177.1 Circadian clock protein kinase KaiC [Chroococcidiopsis cubana SAG 39.79]PSB66397.1 circadian clock protein KaiC [Chroococcidiopsis cubana CCALA 043]PSM47594.1 circadian clock protein KaiC [Chroococcidiopsis sp. CCALA 051]RUT13054.1 circadian clock protein kinase KaiC [Chroococcidiopsis cubana SAG 39.79]